MQLTIDHKYLLLTSLITIVETFSLFPPCQFWEQEYFNAQRKLNFGTVGGGGGGKEKIQWIWGKEDIFNQACFPFLTLDQLKLIDQ